MDEGGHAMSGCRPDHACCHEARALKSEKAALELRVKELEELNAGNVADFLNELNGFKLRAEKAEAELARFKPEVREFYKRAAGRESGREQVASAQDPSVGNARTTAAKSAARINPCPRCGGSRHPDDVWECAG